MWSRNLFLYLRSSVALRTKSAQFVKEINSSRFSVAFLSTKSPTCVEESDKEKETEQQERIQPSLGRRAKLFESSEPELILDYHEEKDAQRDAMKDGIPLPYLYQQKKQDTYEGLDIKRGVEGVFDIDDLIEALKHERMKDIAVIKLPRALNYCDYLVLCNARSSRHLRAVSEFINKLYKLKSDEDDPFIFIEGKDCDDWHAIDMGRIVLHIMTSNIRERYDIDTLWAVGSEFDDLTQRQGAGDEVDSLIDKHMTYLKNLEAND